MAVIHKGQLQAEGEPSALLARYGQPNLEELFFFLVKQAQNPGAEGAKSLTSWDE
jgi:sodium transport system ATP-binding protein